uniref:CUB domain-containing protein n=1 Tax=Magallana gigas TaxID=29159 RepID=A0A8W8N0B4_MAGGI
MYGRVILPVKLSPQISGNNRIEITFKDFLLEYSNNCQSDSLEVQLETDVSIPGKRYCGSELTNTTLVSKGNFAIVTLRTNARNHGRGFQLTANPVQSRARSISDHFMNIPISFWKKLFEVPGRFGLG